MECEDNGKLPFLDTVIERGPNNKFKSSVYRKPTFSGLGISFFSFSSYRFKINSIQTLLFRAYTICSTYASLHNEFEFLRNFFTKNGFPLGVVNTQIKKFLAKKYDSVIVQNPVNVPARDFYLSLPYFGHQSEKLKSELATLLSKYFKEKSFKIILVNSFTIGSFFRFKDRLPRVMQSSLVYKYCCARCASCYVGSTVRNLYMRVAEHAGKSYRTGVRLSRPPLSAIRDHAEADCDERVTDDSFTILGTASNSVELRILESLYILKLKPCLNDNSSAFSLNLVNR
jgi:hypothetical protein